MMILHSDANCFYASVEMVENPDLRNQRIAVCGDPEQRHGIVLTANYPAKRMGVKTGMANWQAMQACPGLVKVKPHYDLYLKYSKLLQRIYKRYSDNVEPFGMDECWISLPYDEDDAVSVAEEIRQTVKDETGLTVSIGASFSKALAKLGSDMKKPDALTVLRKSDFKEKCWDLPVSDLLYVGPRTTKKLNNIAITTIGQLANAPPISLPGNSERTASWFRLSPTAQTVRLLHRWITVRPQSLSDTAQHAPEIWKTTILSGWHWMSWRRTSVTG